MTTLSRNSVRSGAYLDSFDSLPRDIRWTSDRIFQSLADTLGAGPEPDDIWLFAYGSLIWNPLIEFAERRKANLPDWHRSFCLRMIAGRGHPTTPGRMLAVEPGGTTQGIAYRLIAPLVDCELRLVWIREMVAGSYRPSWCPITLETGRIVPAIVFTADPTRPYYEGDSSVATVAPLISSASGSHGTNADYAFQLAAALVEEGLADPYVESLVQSIASSSTTPGR